MMEKEEKKEEIEKEIRELVKARLNVLPEDICVSIGTNGETYRRDDLISHVENESEIGKKMIEIDMEFMRALKKGEFYEQAAFNHEA